MSGPTSPWRSALKTRLPWIKTVLEWLRVCCCWNQRKSLFTLKSLWILSFVVVSCSTPERPDVCQFDRNSHDTYLAADSINWMWMCDVERQLCRRGRRPGLLTDSCCSSVYVCGRWRHALCWPLLMVVRHRGEFFDLEVVTVWERTNRQATALCLLHCFTVATPPSCRGYQLNHVKCHSYRQNKSTVYTACNRPECHRSLLRYQ